MFNKCKIEKISLTTNNGRNVSLITTFTNIVFYESIYDYFLHGSIVIVDTYDLVVNLPIIGNETLSIKFTDSDNNFIESDFKIYKLDKDSSPTETENKRKFLKLYFCSNEKLVFENKRISRKFIGSGDNSITKLLSFSESKKVTDFSSTDDLDYYSNFWLLKENIDYILKKSRSNFSDFVFFESFDGFYFKTVSELIKESSIETIYYGKSINESINSSNIKAFQFNAYFNLLMNMKLGINGTKNYYIHPDEYSLKYVESDFKESIENISTTGKSISFADDLFSKSNNITFTIDEKEEKDNLKFFEKKLSINLLKSYNFIAKLNGSFNRKTGDIIEIQFPNGDNESPVNLSFAGNFLIVAIKHIFTSKNVYEQNLSLVKNSLFKNPELEEQTKNVNL